MEEVRPRFRTEDETKSLQRMSALFKLKTKGAGEVQGSSAA